MKKLLAVAAGASAAVMMTTGPASADIRVMPNAHRAAAQYNNPTAVPADYDPTAYNPVDGPGITPPAPPCVLNGLAPDVSVPVLGSVGVSCGIPEAFATGLPFMGNMAYYGGKVQVHPKLYVVFWGWGQQGAFSKDCTPVKLDEGQFKAKLPCDPDGAGMKMANFVAQMGGTDWAASQTQYFEYAADGSKQYISNDKDLLAGIWVDNSTQKTMQDFKKSSLDNEVGPTNTGWMLAKEATRASDHFHVSGTALADAQFLILEPQNFSDPSAEAYGYCAWHDWTGYDYYEGVKHSNGKSVTNIEDALSFTNMPYVINQGDGCGAHTVNSGAAGDLDGVTTALGHEIEETITDPGAETQLGSGPGVTAYGGWYDPLDANENGDKCAYVGDLFGLLVPMPGAVGTMTGRSGEDFTVQSLWSNDDNLGTGYCAGAGTDTGLPTFNGSAHGPDGAPGSPSATKAPAVIGKALAGRTLRATHGAWTNGADSYAFQWFRCSAKGTQCVAIDGATSSRYHVSRADRRHKLLVQVYAANAVGSSPMSSSSKAVTVR